MSEKLPTAPTEGADVGTASPWSPLSENENADPVVFISYVPDRHELLEHQTKILLVIISTLD